MGYKFKPNKSVAKRFKVTKTGKLKRGHGFRSHLMSSRSANSRRLARKGAILHEGHAKNMRAMMGIAGKKPARARHRAELVVKADEAAAAAALVAAEAPLAV